jgi:hypothetical protein
MVGLECVKAVGHHSSIGFLGHITPNFCIDLTPVYSYNTRMEYVSQYDTGLSPFIGGFFRPDHDPPTAPAF